MCKKEKSKKKESRQEAIIRFIFTLLDPGIGFGSWAWATGYAATFLTPGNHQDLAARRTRRVRSKPRVDTRNVETVTALGQHSELIAGGELHQADRALGQFLRRRRIRRVCELRQRSENFLFQSFVGRSYRRLVILIGVRGGAPTGSDATKPGASRDGD